MGKRPHGPRKPESAQRRIERGIDRRSGRVAPPATVTPPESVIMEVEHDYFAELGLKAACKAGEHKPKKEIPDSEAVCEAAPEKVNEEPADHDISEELGLKAVCKAGMRKPKKELPESEKEQKARDKHHRKERRSLKWRSKCAK